MDEKKERFGWWKRKTTIGKVCFIISMIILIAALIAFFLFMDCRKVFGNEFANAWIGEEAESGWQVMAISMGSGAKKWGITFAVLIGSIIFIFLGNVITHLFDGASRKTKTLASLIRSLNKYIVFIVALCIILVVWGVDVIGIIAGVGVLTLVIGLGCQTLIQDIVSGVFIVVDDYFAVGETVIIDGFRGTVTEVGLKTTKLQDYGGNIKSITNSSITTVVNMSRLKSLASVTISVSYNEDVEHVEALILDRIEKIKKEVPAIIDGPWYKGIDAINASCIDFLIICFVSEADRFQVTRDLKREFYLMCKENDIQIPYPQVSVNQALDENRVKASKEELAIALEHQKQLRGVDVKKKKKKLDLSKQLKESIEKSKYDLDM